MSVCQNIYSLKPEYDIPLYRSLDISYLIHLSPEEMPRTEQWFT